MPQMTLDQALELAESHQQAGRLAPAEAICRQVLGVDPNNAIAMHLLGVIALNSGQTSDAEGWIRKALRLDPDSAPLHCSLGQILAAADRVEDAVAALQRAIELNPDFPEARHDLAVAMMHLKRFDDAIDHYRKTIQLRPDWALAHHDLGLALLLKGKLIEGFAEYEWRYRAPELGTFSQQFAAPRWDGADITGRTILIHSEQGFGDTIQFFRFIPLLLTLGAQVVLQCQPELYELLQGSCPELQVIPRGQPLPQFDVHCPLLSLPWMLGITRQTLPAKTPYLRADPVWIDTFQQRVPPTADLDIGLVWACGIEQRVNGYRKRSIPLDGFLPLLRTEGTRWLSLQKGEAAKEMWSLPADTNLLRGAQEPVSFADSAGRMSRMDLIITVDTAAAHLAGALGRPTWVLVPYIPDWRWMIDRSDSPWYPSVRIFRQPKPGDWETPLQQIADALAEFRINH